MSDQPERLLYSVSEAARLLRKRTADVYTLVYTPGGLESVRNGRTILISHAAILRYIARQEAATAAQLAPVRRRPRRVS